MNTESHSEKKKRLTLISRIALVCGLGALVISIIGSLALYLNWDIIPDEAKGPHPWIGFLGEWVSFGAFYGSGAGMLLSLISIFRGILRKPRAINITVSLIGLLTAYIGISIVMVTLNRVRAASVRIYIYNLHGLDYALKEHAKEHDGQLPSAAIWCDAVGKIYPSGLKNDMDPNDEGLSNYAFNINLSELKLAELPKDVVLLFETPLAKNPVGGPELIKADGHPRKGCFVLFGDMHVEFVRAEDFNDLRWKPQ